MITSTQQQQERLVTLGEMIQFVLIHRRGNAFKHYTEREIANSIWWSAEGKSLRYACNGEGKLVGICTSFDDKEHSTLHIHDVLTIESWVFRVLIKSFRDSYPGYSLTGLRDGKLVRYNTPRFVSLVLKGAA